MTPLSAASTQLPMVPSQGRAPPGHSNLKSVGSTCSLLLRGSEGLGALAAFCVNPGSCPIASLLSWQPSSSPSETQLLAHSAHSLRTRAWFLPVTLALSYLQAQCGHPGSTSNHLAHQVQRQRWRPLTSFSWLGFCLFDDCPVSNCS